MYDDDDDLLIQKPQNIKLQLDMSTHAKKKIYQATDAKQCKVF